MVPPKQGECNRAAKGASSTGVEFAAMSRNVRALQASRPAQGGPVD
jgi:hypothetical protein